MLKYWANLSAVSAVIPQRALTISLIRSSVTPMCLANRLLDKPKGSINSCFKISPDVQGLERLTHYETFAQRSHYEGKY